MASTVTVWVRMRDSGEEADRLRSSTPGALPLILRMRSSNPAEEQDFVFPYSPREMSIGQLADEMVQIPRPGTTPIVAFKSHRLMTLDFTALIAHPGDGLIRDVEKEIFNLRSFASSSNKVFQLINYDVFTQEPYVFRNMSEERVSGLFFSITDMGVEVMRRNKDNLITQANVRISLVENRNPRINVVLIPPLTLKKPNPNCTKPKYAKKYPEKCKKPPGEPTAVGFSKSQRESANAFFNRRNSGLGTFAPDHRQNFKLCYIKVAKMARWVPMNTTPCLGNPK
jgi:hypothetical protein